MAKRNGAKHGGEAGGEAGETAAKPQNRGRRIDLLQQSIRDLPALPVLSREIIAADEDIELCALVDRIDADSHLSASVRRLGDAAYGGLVSVGGLESAAVMIGSRGLSRLVLTAQILEILCDDPGGAAENGNQGFDRAGYLMHCVAVASASDRIAARLLPSVRPPAAFCASLLHGAGRLALAAVAPRGMDATARLAIGSGLSAAVAEERAFGISGGSSGRLLAARWDLPGDLQEVLSSCGEAAVPAVSGSALPGIVAVAKWACRRYHLGWSGDWSDPGDGAVVLGAFGLDRAHIDGLMPEIVSTWAERSSLLLGSLPGFRELPAVPATGDHVSQGVDRLALLVAEQANRTLDAMIRRGANAPHRQRSGSSAA